MRPTIGDERIKITIRITITRMSPQQNCHVPGSARVFLTLVPGCYTYQTSYRDSAFLTAGAEEPIFRFGQGSRR